MSIFIHRYETLEACMAAYFDCAPEDIKKQGRWAWMDGERYRVWPTSRVLRTRRKAGVWGFCVDKKELHVWIADHARPEKILRLLAHELGHIRRPWHRDRDQEEAKAENYAMVAVTAFVIMQDITSKEKQ